MRPSTSRHDTFPGTIHLKCGTVWMNYKIKTVSVLLVSNALFRLQKQQAGFAGGSQSTSERAAQAVVARDTSRQEKTVWAPPGGAQWAKSGGEAVLLQFSDFTKDPMHDFNRLFCWKSCDCEFWPYIMYLLQYKHEKVHASDDKSIKMNHATLIMKQNAAARWHCNAEYLM